MARRFRLLHRQPTRRFRGDLEDTLTYVLFSLPVILFTLWYGVDMYELYHAHQIVHDAAVAAATSAATQASYAVATSIGGTGFDTGVNDSQATTIANQTFALEANAIGLANVVSVSNPNLTFPAPGQAAYSVTVSYVPQGVFATIDVLNAIFENGQIPPSPPAITWTETGTAQQNQPTTGAN